MAITFYTVIIIKLMKDAKSLKSLIAIKCNQTYCIIC